MVALTPREWKWFTACRTADASIAFRKNPSFVAAAEFVVGYVGIVNEQDGVDHIVRAAGEIVRRGFRDFRVVVVGDGPALGQVRELTKSLNLDDFIVFTGYLSGQALLAHLSAFDIGVIPDPYNEANDLMSMNKVFEYCALAIPTACYPLKETRRLLGDAGVYASTLDPVGLADACVSLMQATRFGTAAPKKPQGSQRRRSSGSTRQRSTSKHMSAY